MASVSADGSTPKKSARPRRVKDESERRSSERSAGAAPFPFAPARAPPAASASTTSTRTPPSRPSAPPRARASGHASSRASRAAPAPPRPQEEPQAPPRGRPPPHAGWPPAARHAARQCRRRARAPAARCRGSGGGRKRAKCARERERERRAGPRADVHAYGEAWGASRVLGGRGCGGARASGGGGGSAHCARGAPRGGARGRGARREARGEGPESAEQTQSLRARSRPRPGGRGFSQRSLRRRAAPWRRPPGSRAPRRAAAGRAGGARANARGAGPRGGGRREAAAAARAVAAAAPTGVEALASCDIPLRFDSAPNVHVAVYGVIHCTPRGEIGDALLARRRPRWSWRRPRRPQRLRAHGDDHARGGCGHRRALRRQDVRGVRHGALESPAVPRRAGRRRRVRGRPRKHGRRAARVRDRVAERREARVRRPPQERDVAPAHARGDGVLRRRLLHRRQHRAVLRGDPPAALRTPRARPRRPRSPTTSGATSPSWSATSCCCTAARGG